jgi:hypothetical protein
MYHHHHHNHYFAEAASACSSLLGKVGRRSLDSKKEFREKEDLEVMVVWHFEGVLVVCRKVIGVSLVKRFVRARDSLGSIDLVA